MEQINYNPYVLSIFSALFGALITLIISKVRNKTGIFGYTTTFNRVGLSTDDSVFGSIRATWQGHQVRNLHICTLEVENLSLQDYDNVEFRIFSGNETLILNERTEVVDSPYIVKFSDAYQKRIEVPEGQQATEQQLDHYNHNREYMLPVFNRGQKLRFSYLCTKPNDDLEPGVFLSTPSKGVKIKELKRPYVVLNPIWGVPVPSAVARAFLIAILVVIFCGLYIESIWLASFISMVIGLTGQIFGAILYKIEKFIKRIIAG